MSESIAKKIADQLPGPEASAAGEKHDVFRWCQNCSARRIFYRRNGKLFCDECDASVAQGAAPIAPATAKPSAEGDGWIAVTEAYPPDAVTVRVRAKNLRRTHSSPYSGVDGEYDGFYDHEEAQWQCYTGPHDSAHLWDCDVEAWLPAPPSGQGEKA